MARVVAHSLTTALGRQRQATHIYRKAPDSQPTEKPCFKKKLKIKKRHKTIYGNFILGGKRPLLRLDLGDPYERAECELYPAETHSAPVRKGSVLRGYYRNESNPAPARKRFTTWYTLCCQACAWPTRDATFTKQMDLGH